MDQPKYDRIEISKAARDAYAAEEARKAAEAEAEARANAWRTAPGIEEKDPNGHFRAIGIDPDSYSASTPDQQKATVDSAYKSFADRWRQSGTAADQNEMRRINVARDALTGKNQPPGGK